MKRVVYRYPSFSNVFDVKLQIRCSPSHPIIPLSRTSLTLQYWRSNNYTNTGAGSNRPRQVLAYISVTINIINLLLLSILSEIWSRNRLVAFLILTTISFPRWRPIWPPNHNNSHISAHKHDKQILCRLLCIHGPGIQWLHFQS